MLQELLPENRSVRHSWLVRNDLSLDGCLEMGVTSVTDIVAYPNKLLWPVVTGDEHNCYTQHTILRNER